MTIMYEWVAEADGGLHSLVLDCVYAGSVYGWAKLGICRFRLTYDERVG